MTNTNPEPSYTTERVTVTVDFKRLLIILAIVITL